MKRIILIGLTAVLMTALISWASIEANGKEEAGTPVPTPETSTVPVEPEKEDSRAELATTAAAIEVGVELPEPEPEPEPELVSMGTFKAFAYCNCKKCCGKWSGGPTASGVMPEQGRTIAVDPTVVPLGATVYIDGQAYVAEDTGSAIKGQTIDRLMEMCECVEMFWESWRGK